MGYTHIFLFFMCVNFGLGITTIADTPLSVPTAYERCYADYSDTSGMQTIVTWWGDDGIDNDGDGSTDENDDSEQRWGPPAGSLGDVLDGIVDEQAWWGSDGIDNDGDGTVDENDPSEQRYGPSGQMINPQDPTGDASGTIGTIFDPITESVEGGYQILNTMKNFIAGGYITGVLEHLTLTCNFEGSPLQYIGDPANEVPNPDYNPNFGEPIQNEVWGYFMGGIQVIFGFLLALTLFNWLTGRSTDLGS